MTESHPTPRELTGPRVLGAAAAAVVVVLIVVKILTHVLAPRLLTHYERFPALAHAPKRTVDVKGTDADPVNVVLVGTEDEITGAFRAAGWTVADSLSRASDIAIAKSVLLNRPDSAAPVSSLFLFDRRQDLAYEQEVGPSARRRHHVRLWRDRELTYGGRPVWIGGATYDARAGLSHRGLHPTHHIAPDIDEERDGLEEALANAGQVRETFRVTGIGVRVDAHNAEGDRYDTDGEQRVVVVSPGNVRHAPPADPGVPFLVAMKDRFWRWGHHLRRAT
ncbi:MAG: LssY C-terminal domain-containing protein [Gemmatimonadota bacterium]|nr:LssY C-terminal domain-containing protein [Gemmatimonadota bacterium]